MFKKSFYDWCYENNHADFLERWDYNKNSIDPHNIGSSNNKENIYFKCELNKHESESHKLSDITRNEHIPKCSICGSFGEWCEQNNHMDFLKRWDYDKNKVSPYEVPISHTKKIYFKCPRGIHESEAKDLNNMRKQYKSGLCKKCGSIGQFLIDTYGENAIHDLWSSKNKDNPFNIGKGSQKKIWIKCTKKMYHPDYEISSSNFIRGKGCPYCSHKKVCIEDSLGKLYPYSIEIWSKQNKETPFEFLPFSNKKIFWKCENNIHTDYKRGICNAVKLNFRCPQCSKNRTESILQEKVRSYIESLYDNVNHEYNCTIIARNPKTNRLLPFDNEIRDLKLIIEVNGEQHYKENAYYFFKAKGKTPKERLSYRRFLDYLKKDYALKNGYHFLVIPYWADDSKKTWKTLIDNKIKEIGG